ncbi:hypothetical protein AVEN_54942-1 [Araneus ventricosus]|uniref:Uncharacterized protein n=1 Tax=Araneus ventricosus TaxID=182803 RepID=A0A4Y2THY3_ARAVE|nr:hypothetical protein AVEN_54942-1 [Araneus ventricosus]
MLLCSSFVQICYDKIISRKIKLAANVHVIWVVPKPAGVNIALEGGLISIKKINKNKIPVDEDEMDDDVPRLTLQDMMDDLNLEEDATGEEGGPMME